MADPRTSVEVDEIISSIKRLVSSNANRAQIPAKKDMVKMERLVLLPEQRVTPSRVPGRPGASAQRVPRPALSADQPPQSFQPKPQPVPVTDSSNPPPDDATPEDLRRKIAALEQIIAGQNEDWEPDDIGTGDNAGTEGDTMEWPTADFAPVEEPDDPFPPAHAVAPETAVSPPAEAEATDNLFAHSQGIIEDELMLRELVTEVIREELQGELGERITRNVRKLVRREINRALAVRTFD